MSSSPDFEAAPPYLPLPIPESDKVVVALRFVDPLDWLILGWRDLVAQPLISAFYGVLFWLLALELGLTFSAQPKRALFMASGYLLIGLFLSTGLLEVSRRREAHVPLSLWAVLVYWWFHVRNLAVVALLLVLLALLWASASVAGFALFFEAGIPRTGMAVVAVFTPENLDFVAAYLALTGVFGVMAFSVAVVSIPMLLDRSTTALSALSTSVQVVFNNFDVMLCWGLVSALVLLLTLLMPLALGMLLVAPVLGYASWHAYRGSVQWLVQEGKEVG